MSRFLWGISLAMLASGSANAALVSRLSGQAYYDTVLNITWLADANYAQTSAYDADGLMDWSAAQAWIASLNTANFLGANSWRLPTTQQPDPSCMYQTNSPPHPLQGYGWNCTGSEMGHLFYVDGISNAMPSSFSNVQAAFYWSDTSYAPNPSSAWSFQFGNGQQTGNVTKTANRYAWAVLPGDISPVPVPAAAWMFGGALGLLGLIRRKILNRTAG